MPGKAYADDLKKIIEMYYSPGQPIIDPNLFSGRRVLIDYLKDQIRITGKNFIFFGARGVGKTSLFNVLLDGYKIQKHNCSHNDDFVTIFFKYSKQIRRAIYSKRSRIAGKSRI